jgi:hypothetical protein
MRLFVQHWLADPKRNGTHAAIEAGYPKTSAASAARRILKRPEVQAYIRQEEEKVHREVMIDLNKQLQRVDAIANQNFQDYYTVDAKGVPHLDLRKISRAQAAAIAKVKTVYHNGKLKRADVEFYDPLQANEVLLRLKGAFKEDNEQKRAMIGTELPADECEQIRTAMRERQGENDANSDQ